MNTLDYTITIRHLRDYYNAVAETVNALHEELITMDESETELIALDEKYAKLITESLAP